MFRVLNMEREREREEGSRNLGDGSEKGAGVAT